MKDALQLSLNPRLIVHSALMDFTAADCVAYIDHTGHKV